MVLNLPNLILSAYKAITCRQILYLTLTGGYFANAMLASIFSIAVVAISEQESLQWSESDKQDILGIFYLGFAASKIPSGGLADIFGPKRVIGSSMILASIVTVATPLIVHWDYNAILMSRVVVGFFNGCMFPCLFPLTANWYSVTPSSKFLSCMEAGAIGIGFTFLCGGYIMDSYGWPMIFYSVGIVSLLWTGLWFRLVYDSPSDHPRITLEERNAIETEISNVGERKKFNFCEIPWKGIVTSGPVWAILVAQSANYYLFAVLTNELPSYVGEVLNSDISKVGLISSLPVISKFFSSIFFGQVADYLLKNGKLKKVSIRRLFEGFGLLIPGVLLSIQALFGQSLAISLLTLISAKLINGACVAGHYANLIDIASNFSGVVAGWVLTYSAVTMYLSAKITAWLLQDGNGFEEWSNTFWIGAGICFVGYGFFIVFAKAKPERWNCINNVET